MSINKNLKLYQHNFNKTSNKEYYYITNTLYLKDIYIINEKLLYNIVPIEQLLSDINFLLNKHSILINKNKYNSYLTLRNLLSKVDDKMRLQTLQAELADALDQLNNRPPCICGVGRSNLISRPINTVQNTSIKSEYRKYVQLYGIPTDGIFLPSLLLLIRRNFI